MQQQVSEQIVFEAGDFHTVESIDLFWDHEAAVPELRLRAVLRNLAQPGQRLRLDFNGVTGLKLEAALSFDDRIGTICIRDISDREWSDLNFEVFEPESQGLRFMCSSWAKR